MEEDKHKGHGEALRYLHTMKIDFKLTEQQIKMSKIQNWATILKLSNFSKTEQLSIVEFKPKQLLSK